MSFDGRHTKRNAAESKAMTRSTLCALCECQNLLLSHRLPVHILPIRARWSARKMLFVVKSKIIATFAQMIREMISMTLIHKSRREREVGDLLEKRETRE